MEQPVGVKAYRQEEWGLRLPDETELWPPQQFHGRNFATAQEREVIFRSILASEENLHMDTQELVNRFRWLRREVTITVVQEVPHAVFGLEEFDGFPPSDFADLKDRLLHYSAEDQHPDIPPPEDPGPDPYEEYAPGMTAH